MSWRHDGSRSGWPLSNPDSGHTEPLHSLQSEQTLIIFTHCLSSSRLSFLSPCTIVFLSEMFNLNRSRESFFFVLPSSFHGHFFYLVRFSQMKYFHSFKSNQYSAYSEVSPQSASTLSHFCMNIIFGSSRKPETFLIISPFRSLYSVYVLHILFHLKSTEI